MHKNLCITCFRRFVAVISGIKCLKFVSLTLAYNLTPHTFIMDYTYHALKRNFLMLLPLLLSLGGFRLCCIFTVYCQLMLIGTGIVVCLKRMVLYDHYNAHKQIKKVGTSKSHSYNLLPHNYNATNVDEAVGWFQRLRNNRH